MMPADVAQETTLNPVLIHEGSIYIFVSNANLVLTKIYIL